MALTHVGATLGLGEKAGSPSLRISEKKKTHRVLTGVLWASVFLEKLVIFIKQVFFFLRGTYGPSSASSIFKEHSFYFFL